MLSGMLDGGDYVPCEIDAVICVGAIAGSWNSTASGEQAKRAKNYSNYGSSVDIWAPTTFLSTTTPDTAATDSNGSSADRLNPSAMPATSSAATMSALRRG